MFLPAVIGDFLAVVGASQPSLEIDPAYVGVVLVTVGVGPAYAGVSSWVEAWKP